MVKEIKTPYDELVAELGENNPSAGFGRAKRGAYREGYRQAIQNVAPGITELKEIIASIDRYDDAYHWPTWLKARLNLVMAKLKGEADGT